MCVCVISSNAKLILYNIICFVALMCNHVKLNKKSIIFISNMVEFIYELFD